LVARWRSDGSLSGAGAIDLGLRHDVVEALERRLKAPMLRRGAVTWYPVDVTVLASLHGLPEGPVRDAVLREVLTNGNRTPPAYLLSHQIRECTRRDTTPTTCDNTFVAFAPNSRMPRRD
jgi:hypothetical protein